MMKRGLLQEILGQIIVTSKQVRQMSEQTNKLLSENKQTNKSYYLCSSRY